MSGLSSAFVQAVKASLDLRLLRRTGPSLGDEIFAAAKQGDAAASEQVMAWYKPILLNQREEHDAIKDILSTVGPNETINAPRRGDLPVIATGEQSSHVVTTESLMEILSMTRHARVAATIIKSPKPYSAELICAASPASSVDPNLVVALVRWDEVKDLGEADLSELLARIKGKLEATWSLFDGDDYAHKNPASGELKIVLLGRVGDAAVSLVMKDGGLQHALREEDLPLLGSAARIVLVDEKAWAIDVQSVRESNQAFGSVAVLNTDTVPLTTSTSASVYFVHRTTADIIWLYGDKEEPAHKVFRAQTLRDMLRETEAINVQEVLPFLAVEDMIEYLEMMCEWLWTKSLCRLLYTD